MSQPTVQPDYTNPFELKQALLYLYKLQTEGEQKTQSTSESNGRGFSALDATFLSSIASQVLNGKGLTAKQLDACAKLLPRYRRQLQNGEWSKITPPTPGSLPIQPALDYKALFRQRTESLFGYTLPEDATGAVVYSEEKDRLVFIPNVYPSKQAKQAGFSMWDTKSQHWAQFIPNINLSSISAIQEAFGGKVVIHPTVEQAVAPKTANIKSLKKTSLFEYQKEAVGFMVGNKRALLSLAPGLGKTACAIQAALLAGCSKILIISPLSLLKNWRKEIKQWAKEDAAIIYKAQLPAGARFSITNFDTLRRHPTTFLGEQWDCIIVDESILVKTRSTARTLTVQQLVEDCKPEFCWLLSGAPVTKFYSDLWAQFNILDPKRFKSYWKFVERYCVVEANQWTKYNIVANKPDAPKRILEDHADIFFSRSQDDVLDLPEWIVDDYPIPLYKEQEKTYLEMEEQFMAMLEDGSKLLAPNVLAQMVRLIQIASNPALIKGVPKSSKWEAVIDIMGYEQAPFIIWTNFIPTARELAEKLKGLKYRVASLTGETPANDRQDIVDSFQNGELDVIVAHPGVGKYGLTLTRARTAIYLERGYSLDDYIQSLYRIRRIGTEHRPHVIHLLATKQDGSPTVDSVIHQILSSRHDMVKKITHRDLKKMFTGE